ncbi:MAG: DNA repair protein RadC [Lentimonas sp.]|jgi:DNA repair protein RadC
MTKEKPHYLGHRKRLKEKFLKESSNLPDYEILEILLFSALPRKDVKDLAKKLLVKFGSLDSLIKADFSKLKELEDVSDGVLISLKLIKEIISRSSKETISKKEVISNWQKLQEYCQITMKNLAEEQFRVLFLDKKHHLIADELIKAGGIEEVEIDIKNLVKKSLNLLAKSVILLHNHPHLSSKPSKSDIVNTKKITETLESVKVKVLDHLIIGNEGDLFSFKSEGLL